MKLKRLPFNSVCYLETELIQDVVDNIQNQAGICIYPRPQVYVVDQTRGHARYDHALCCIAKWVFEADKRKPGYLIWYTAHELAHLLQRQFYRYSSQHDEHFMRALKLLCPKQYIHYELEYKPRNAQAAGISKEISADDL